MKHNALVALLAATTGLILAPAPASSQRLLDEWRVRTTAGAEALATGATAVFWNPAQVTAPGRGEAMVADLRAPGMTGVDGLVAALAFRLDGRTVLAAGYEYMGVEGLEGTTTSPDAGAPLDIGENRFGFAASHEVNERTRVGALVQYTRMPAIASDNSVIALGAGMHYAPPVRLPLALAGSVAFEGEDINWLAGAAVTSGRLWTDWQLRGEYGAAGGDMQPGITHRVTAIGEWRDHVSVSLGAASEPDGMSRTVQPVLGAELRLYRYRLGLVREELANEFGGAWSFRFTVGF